MRSPRNVLLGTLALGAVAFIIVALLRGGDRVFTLGVPNNAAVVTLGPGEAFCQEQILPPRSESFDRIQMTLGTFGRSGPPITATVRDRTDRELARGTLAGGYPDITQAPRRVLRLDRAVPTSDDMSVCFRNRGDAMVAWYGAADVASVPTTAVLEGDRPTGVDVNLVFLGEDRSYLSRLGDIAERARLFRAGPLLPGWAYVLLIVGLVGAGAAGLVAAVGSLRTDED